MEEKREMAHTVKVRRTFVCIEQMAGMQHRRETSQATQGSPKMQYAVVIQTILPPACLVQPDE